MHVRCGVEVTWENDTRDRGRERERGADTQRKRDREREREGERERELHRCQPPMRQFMWHDDSVVRALVVDCLDILQSAVADTSEWHVQRERERERERERRRLVQGKCAMAVVVEMKCVSAMSSGACRCCLAAFKFFEQP